MIRNGSGLTPEVLLLAQQHVARVSSELPGIELLVYCTYRSPEEQATLWAKGRTKAQIEAKVTSLREKGFPKLATILLRATPTPGPIVTKAPPGFSYHQYGVAYDCVPLRAGKPVWGRSGREDSALWEKVGIIGESLRLDWAGRWTSFQEFPHFQLTTDETFETLAKRWEV